MDYTYRENVGVITLRMIMIMYPTTQNTEDNIEGRSCSMTTGCGIMEKVVLRVKLDQTCGRSSSIQVAIYHTARTTVSIYFCCKCQIPVSTETISGHCTIHQSRVL